MYGFRVASFTHSGIGGLVFLLVGTQVYREKKGRVRRELLVFWVGHSGDEEQKQTASRRREGTGAQDAVANPSWHGVGDYRQTSVEVGDMLFLSSN